MSRRQRCAALPGACNQRLWLKGLRLLPWQRRVQHMRLQITPQSNRRATEVGFGSQPRNENPLLPVFVYGCRCCLVIACQAL